MKTFKTLIFLFLFVLLSCDTPYDVFYEIENCTDKNVIIETRIGLSYVPDKEKTFNIAPGETVCVHNTGGVNAKDYIPPDEYFSPDDLLPRDFVKFDIYVGGILMEDSLRCRKNWEFFSKKLLGVYTLRITDD